MGGSVGSVGSVAPGGLAPGRDGAQLRGDLRPVAVRVPLRAEGVVVALPERLPVRAVEAQLHVPGVRARRQRTRPGGETDLQIAVGGGRRIRQRLEGAGDVAAALHRPRAGETVGGGRGVALEVVAHLDVGERHARTPRVPYLEPRLALVGRRPRRARAVLDDEPAGRRRTGGRRQGGEGRAAQGQGDGGGRRRADTAPAGCPLGGVAHGGVPLRNGGGRVTEGVALYLRRRSPGTAWSEAGSGRRGRPAGRCGHAAARRNRPSRRARRTRHGPPGRTAGDR